MPDNTEEPKKKDEVEKQEPEKDKKPEEETKKQDVIPTTPEEPKPKEEEAVPGEKQESDVMNMLVEIRGGIAKIAELLTAAQAPAASAPLAETAKAGKLKKQDEKKPDPAEPPKEPEKKEEEPKPAEDAATKALKKSTLPTDTPRLPGEKLHYDPTKAGKKPENDAVAVAKGEKVLDTRKAIQEGGIAN